MAHYIIVSKYLLHFCPYEPHTQRVKEVI